MIRVRFAPSPTGYLHIGGARTALFNWMYAKSQEGTFILRIEDTDQGRSDQRYTQEILDSLKWLGLDWDEMYYQSQRFSLYTEYARKLLDEKKAYKDGEAVVLRMPQQEVKIYDLIRGEIAFDSSMIKDQVLIKSDQTPTYSFACAVDDALMKISHVIRGDDHISNTPKQVVIYQALGFEVPKFAHLPLILGEDGDRLSKRTGAVAVSEYRMMGFLPEALVNYLMLLGWSPGGNQEVVGLKSAVKKFSIKKVNKTAATFSMNKLKWINSQYLKNTETEQLMELLIPFLKERHYINGNFDRQGLKNVVQLFKIRIATLVDFLEWTDFIFLEEVKFDQQAKEKHLLLDRSKEFRVLRERLEPLESFEAPLIEKVFRESVAELGLQAGDLVHPVRVALTGKAVGPGLFETMAVLGKEKTIRRLREAFEVTSY